MVGFMIGTLCLVGLVGLHSRHRCGHGDGRWSRGHRRRARTSDASVFGRAMAEVVKRRLDIDEEQEGIVDHALRDLREALHELRTEIRDTRGSLAGAFRGEEVDDAAIAAAFSRHDDALARARRQVVSAMKQIHAVLDEEQRARAADWRAQAGEGRRGPEAWV